MLGITTLANSSVSEETKLRTVHHSNMKTHVRYQRLTNENISKKYKAMKPLLRMPSSADQDSPKKSFSPVPQENNKFKTFNYITPNNLTPQNYLSLNNIVININTPNPQTVSPSMGSVVSNQHMAFFPIVEIQTNPTFHLVLTRTPQFKACSMTRILLIFLRRISKKGREMIIDWEYKGQMMLSDFLSFGNFFRIQFAMV